MLMKLKTPESPPYRLIPKKTILVINWRMCFQARRAGTSHCELQGIHGQRNGAVLILLLHALRFQLSEIQLGQWHHHCSIA
jgi:hypothetical protein